jgi:tetratricopeptide (TPR) repeat protein
MKNSFIYLACLFLTLFAKPSFAQHPIDIQRLAANGQYFEALVEYLKLPQRRATTEAVISAARSYWASSLPQRAIDEYEKALRDEKLAATERARIYLSRAIIEYQEDRFQTSVLYAERAVGLINEAGPLRSKSFLVWAQALDRMNLQGPAEEKYIQAQAESDTDDKPEISFLLARCQKRLGKYAEAISNFEKVPLRNVRTAEAIRNLGELAMDSGRFDDAEFWLQKGRADYPDDFLDSWVDYALLKIAISKNDLEKVNNIYTDSSKRYAPSDHWYTLLAAATAAYRSSNAMLAQVNVGG